jgi:hypothetical protein
LLDGSGDFDEDDEYDIEGFNEDSSKIVDLIERSNHPSKQKLYNGGFNSISSPFVALAKVVCDDNSIKFKNEL